MKRQRRRIVVAASAFLLAALLATPGRSAEPVADESWLKPPALRPGDTIMLVAPAGPSDETRVRAFARQLEKQGYHVIIPANLFRRRAYLAGSDDERADELNAAIKDPKVDAIFPCRGGYGLMRTLDRIDYAALRAHPKMIIGFSDLTALHLAVARKAHVITFHSPMPEASLAKSGPGIDYANDLFWKSVRSDGFAASPTPGYIIPPPPGEPKPTTLVPGKARGRLVGGNLTLINSTLATPYAIEASGKILFIEDTGEAPYRIDRYLTQLRLAGILDSVAGIVVGHFSESDVVDTERVLREALSGLKVPVILNFPVGHVPINATLPHGALAELDADQGTLRILESPLTTEPSAR
ncbi:S66 peptidase family protein [Singulisphaera sp. PoT]|uniref:S66 peptidase family protein n=1 Tax=Singulisphaera sp. PoT TaxID=3411797 RepID=UPI003BF539F8